MSLTIILSIIIIILIMAMVLNQKFMKDRVETEEYARNQLISKNSILSEENLSLKNQMLSTNNDVGQHAFKNAKRELRKILNRFKEVYSIFSDVLGIPLKSKETDELLDEDIEQLIEERNEARKNKDFARADEIRDMLKARHIILEDTPQGVRFKRG